MADTARKLKSRVLVQAFSLNTLVAALVGAVIYQPTWHAVAALVAVLASLSFYWTQREAVADESKRVEELAQEVKLLAIRLGNLAFKTGFKEK